MMDYRVCYLQNLWYNYSILFLKQNGEIKNDKYGERKSVAKCGGREFK